MVLVLVACSASPVVEIPPEAPQIGNVLGEPFFASFEPSEGGLIEVVDWWERRPVPGARILIRRGQADIGALATDALGRAELPKLGSVTFDLHFSHAQFITRSLLGVSRGNYTIVLGPAPTNRVGPSGDVRLIRGEATLPDFGDVDAVFQVRALSFAGAAALTKRVEPGAPKLEFLFRVFRQSLSLTYATASLATSLDPPADVADPTWASTFAWGLPMQPTAGAQAVSFEMVPVEQAAASLDHAPTIFAGRDGWNAFAFAQIHEGQTSFPGPVVPVAIDGARALLPMPRVEGMQRRLEVRPGLAIVSPDQTASAFRFARATGEDSFEAEPFHQPRRLWRVDEGHWRLDARGPHANLTAVTVTSGFVWEALVFDDRQDLEFPAGALRIPGTATFGRVTDYEFAGEFPGAWSGEHVPRPLGFTTQLQE